MIMQNLRIWNVTVIIRTVFLKNIRIVYSKVIRFLFLFLFLFLKYVFFIRIDFSRFELKVEAFN